MKTGKGSLEPCQQGTLATNVNNEFFTRTALKGTPTIIHEKGQIMPYALLKSPQDMISWASSQ